IKGRRQILDVHARNKPLDSTVDLDVLARQTPGFSGADLANLINEAAILAARANQKVIGMDELEEAIARVIAGPERKSRRISDKEKAIIAYHEVGHALVMKALPHTDPVHKVSIISRGMALGWTMSLPEEDKYLISKNELMDQIAGIMGGRVAEVIVFGRGRLGRSLAKALDARLLAGLQATPDQAPAGALVFLAVPDPAVPALAEKIAPAGAKLVHVSGALTLDALAPAERRGAFHPYQSFPAERPPGHFRGAVIGVDAADQDLLEELKALAEVIGGRPRVVTDEQRPLYHASAV